MISKKVLSVGQCGFDHTAISRMLKGLGAETVKVDLHSEVSAAIAVHNPALVLVNRINDSDGSMGLELIKLLKRDPKTANVPVMLVSNYKDAQADAQRVGAEKGFGKSEIGSEGTLEQLRKQLEAWPG